MLGSWSGRGAVQTFDITLDQRVAPGIPLPGAGALEGPGAVDVYRVPIAAGQTVYFDEQTGFGCTSKLRWKLADPDAVQIFDDAFAAVDQCSSGPDLGAKTFTKTGTYTLTVYGIGDVVDNYAFRLWSVSPQTFPLAINQAVSTGVPQAGAGEIETPGGSDIYTFQATAGQTVYFDELTSRGCLSQLRWNLAGPNGVEIFDEVFAALDQCSSGGDHGLQTLTQSGSYTLKVYGIADAVDTYAFKIWPVESQHFTIAIDQTVSDGAPQAGAGRIESPGVTDVYTFQATAGQTVYFDEMTSRGCLSQLRWNLAGPNGVEIFDEVFAALDQCSSGGDHGLQTLTQSGSYTLKVYGIADAVDTYAFKIWPVESQHFAIAIDQTVSDGAPQAGAGRIESPGVADVYTFQATAGQTVYFDELTSRGCLSQLRWNLAGPTGVEIFDEVFAALDQCSSGGDHGLQTLTQSGSYTLKVYGIADAVDTYAFKIWPVESQHFAIAIDQTVSDGVPQAGAGRIESPGVTDVYTFQATAGQTVYFDEQSGWGCASQLRWRLSDTDGTTLFDDTFAAVDQCSSGGSVGMQALGHTGVYTLTVYGLADAVSDYGFALYPVLPPTIAPIGDVQSLAGSLVKVTPVAIPAIPRGRPLRFSLLSGPTGATVGTNDGAFSWNVPAETQGVFPAIIRVIDSLGGEATMEFQLHITAATDLSVAEVQLPGEAGSGDSIAVRFRENNRGNKTATGTWKDRLWISSDTILGADDLPVSEQSFTGALAPGELVDRSVRISLPELPGVYYLIVQLDSSDAIPESNEANNFGVSAPIQVLSSYTASVHTGVEVAPSGTVVDLQGEAHRRSGGAAVGEPVKIEITTRGTHRSLQAMTDAAGQFTARFVPLPGEAGHYTVGAAHPGEPNVPVQDAFDLVGLSLDPSSGQLNVPAQGTASFRARLKNRSERNLSGISIQAVGVPAGAPFKIKPQTLGSIGAGQEIPVSIEVESLTPSGYVGVASVEASSAEGARASVSLRVQLTPSGSQLAVNPGLLVSGVRRSNQTLVQVELRNDGGLPTGPLRVLLPPVPWMTVANPLPLPSLAPGATAQLSFTAQPPVDFPLGEHSGVIVVTDGTDGVNLPFRFSTLTSSVGSLAVEVLDELTYYGEGSPKVSGARVIVLRHGTMEEIARKTTGADGRVAFPGLTEGLYDVEISAPQHSTFRGTGLVLADQENVIQPFLSRETVRYEFTVVPATIEDRSRVRLEAIFETVVPLPVVTVEPNVIDLADVQSDRTEIELRITNHGLIAAQDLHLQFGSNAGWRFTPLQSDLGDLGARSSVTVPLLIERLTASAPAPVPRLAAVGGAGGAGCGLSGSACWNLLCGKDKKSYCAPILIPMDCFGSEDGFYIPPRFGAEGGLVPTGGLLCNCVALPCDPCGGKLGQALFDFGFPFVLSAAAPGLAGAGGICLKDGASCLSAANECSTNSLCDRDKYGLDCASATISCGAVVAVAAGAAAFELPLGIIGLGLGLASLGKGITDACKETGTVQGAPALATLGTDPTFFPGQAKVRIETERLQRILDAYEAIFGNPVWMNTKLGTNFAAFAQNFSTAVDRGGMAGQRVSAEEGQALLNGPLPEEVPASAVETFIARWNRTLDYNARGIYQLAQLPPGESPDFLAMDILAAKWSAARDAIEEIEAEGHVNDIFGGMRQAIQQLRDNLASAGGGICARVKLRIDQEAVTTRSAFRAQLDLENHSLLPLTGVRVELHIKSIDGRASDTLFGLLPPELSGIQSVDGSGVVEVNSLASAQWVIVPGHEAAPSPDPSIYFIGGFFSYFQEGKLVRVPLSPAPITVYPTPRLSLTYFHERDVLGDDPATDAVEQSVPYSLAVIAKNIGFGTAQQLRIESSQPQIIENEKGLLVDFQLIGSEVDGAPFTPSLNASLGDLPPAQTRVARWLFTSSLQGEFIDYSAVVENIGPLKALPELSTIESVSIHELIHTVHATRPGQIANGKPDFLVNDVQDDEFLPDHLYLSDGTTNLVSVVPSGSFDSAPAAGHLEVKLTTLLPAGWAYLRLPDPGAGNYTLQRVLRADGSEVTLGDNAWTTDRTFIAGGRRPRYEHRLHILAFSAAAGSTEFRLIYALPSSVDVIPPTSGMIRVQATSRPNFGLEWFGGDNPGGAGLRDFDIFVSVNGAPFVPWIERTTLTGAVYSGESGSRYAFYSVATDKAGNRETPPLAPDTETVVNRANTAPALKAAPDLTVSEGETVVLLNSATDADQPPDALVFSLAAGSPPGAVIDPASGTVTWRTGEANGPSTNRITVIATDDGIPPRADSRTIRVVVNEVNTPPVLAEIPDAVIHEGQLLEIPIGAVDFDLPKQALIYSLGPNTPRGASIGQTTGLFRWQPDDTQGPSTNRVSVRVSDGISYAAREFQVIVRDTRADFELSIGRGVVKAGGATNLMIALNSGVDLIELSGTLRIPGELIAIASLENLAPSVGSAVFQTSVPGEWILKLTAAQGQSFQGLEAIAELRVQTAQGDKSGSLAIEVGSLEGLRDDRTPLLAPHHRDGHLTILGRQPVIELIPDSALLRLFGNPGDEVLLEGSLSLDGIPAWTELATYKLIESSIVFDPASLSHPAGKLFLRASLKP